MLAFHLSLGTQASSSKRLHFRPRLEHLEDRTLLAADSKGTDFWLAYMENLGSPELSLFITGDQDTTGTVEIPGLAFSLPFSVTAGTVTTVAVPSTAALSGSDSVQNRGVHVTSEAEVTVYGLNRVQFTTDAFLGLPTDILGNEYIVMAWKNVDIVEGTEFAVVATQDATTVTITPSVATGSRAGGVPYTITLNQGEAYQLQNTGSQPNDLSGTIITADHPIGVYGGHICANIPDGHTLYCDHVVEQLTPTETWGKSFVSEPFASRIGGDTFRMLAANDATIVSVNGVEVATLNRGQFHEQLIAGPATITSNNPILVAQYSNGTTFDGVTSDPFMVLVPPFEQFLGSYTVTTPASGFSSNYINIVAPNSAVGTITLDGVAIGAANFLSIGASGFSGAQIAVGLGSHTLTGLQAFGITVYGFDSYDSYGYPGGMSLAPVARVTHLALTPTSALKKTGDTHVLTATVLDQENQPVEGIRVDFLIAGANSTLGFAFTGANGQAVFGYIGTNEGLDEVTATVGALSDEATATWSALGGGVDLAVDIQNIHRKGNKNTFSVVVENRGGALATDVALLHLLPKHTKVIAVTALPEGARELDAAFIARTSLSFSQHSRLLSIQLGEMESGTHLDLEIVLKGRPAKNFASAMGVLSAQEDIFEPDNFDNIVRGEKVTAAMTDDVIAQLLRAWQSARREFA